MKKTILTLVLTAVFAGAAFADDLSVGYCDGAVVEEGISSVSAVAIGLSPEEFPMYQGSKISGVRIGLQSEALNGIKVFLRATPDGPDLYTFRTKTLYAGWSDIMFDMTVDYPEGNIYVGYEVPTGVKPGMSQIEGITASKQESCLVYSGSKWNDLSNTWKPLCIQLLVDGDSYTKNDVAILTAPKHLIRVNTPSTVTGLLRNNTTSMLTSVHVSCDFGDGPFEAYAEVFETLPGEIGTYTIPLDGISTTGDKTLKISVVSIGGKADDYASNSEAEMPIQVTAVDRKILVEEFTGQGCLNCPTGKSIIEEALKGEENVILICHHIGYGEDELTAPGSNDLTFFYHAPTTYAPAIMFDRYQAPGGSVPVSTIGDVPTMRGRLKSARNEAARAIIGISQKFESGRKLSADIQVQKVAGTGTGSNPVLTALLVEDGIIGFQAPNYDAYEHNEAVRLFLTAPLGDRITFSDEAPETYSYSIDIPKGHDISKMRLVAFVSNYDREDPNNCRVYNAEMQVLPEPSGVEEVETAGRGISEIYSISGIRLDRMQRGVNIVRYTDGTTEKLIVK